MAAIILLIIAFVAPWVVHLVAPRQRAVTLVGAIALLLLFGIFSSNPLTSLLFWAGLIAGIVSILLVGGRLGSHGSSRGHKRPRRDSYDDFGSEQTGEI